MNIVANVLTISPVKHYGFRYFKEKISTFKVQLTITKYVLVVVITPNSEKSTFLSDTI